MTKIKLKRTLLLFVFIMITTIFSSITVNASESENNAADSLKPELSTDISNKHLGSTSNYSIKVNQRYTNQYKSGSSHILKYKITIPEAGTVTPLVYVNEEKNNNCLGWADYLYDSSLTKSYAKSEKHIPYEDANGHQWTIIKYNRCRLPAGTYYFYMGAPSSGLVEYGYFDLIINYTKETSRTDVEKEFNDTRNTANSVSLNKTYFGNNHRNDIDYFRFSFNTKTKISLYFYTSSGSFGMKFEPRVVDNYGNELGHYTHQGKVESSNGTVYDKYLYNLTLNAGTYYFRVSNFYDSFADYKFIINTSPSKVSGLKLTKAGTKKVKISYKSATRATKYEIYRKAKGGSWKKVKTTTAKSWTNSKLKKGKTYYFKVRAINGSTKGTFSSTKKIKVK